MKETTKASHLAKAKEFARHSNRRNRRSQSKESRYDHDSRRETTAVPKGSGLYGDPINDSKWYRDNEQTLKDVARLAYNIPVGLPMARRGSMYPAFNSLWWSVPGIASMEVVPTFGLTDKPTDPVNVAFNGMFTFIRSHTSSNFNWDKCTLAINTMATDSVYYMTKWYSRLYGTLPLFHNANKYLCRALIEAQGVDYDDLLANSANFRAAINMRIARINALKIPSEIYVFKRHQWLFESYYIEGQSLKDQIYMYRPAAYYVHTLDANGKPMLECHRTLTGGSGTGGRLTVADLIRKLDSMLDPIFDDQYFNLISGYIEEAYEGKVMQLPYLPDQIILPLVYSEEVLLQFKNSKPKPVRHATGVGYLDGSFDVVQEATSATDPRLIIRCKVSNPALSVYRSLNDGQAVDVDASSPVGKKWNLMAVFNEYSKDVLLTTPHADVSEEENMINTRNITLVNCDWSSGPSSPTAAITLKECGTEWPIATDIFTRYYDPATGLDDLFSIKFHEVMFHDSSLANAYTLNTKILPIISRFRFMPELRIVERVSDETTDPTSVAPNEMSYFGLDNYTLVDHTTIDMMHRSAQLAMLRVPEIASTNLSAR